MKKLISLILVVFVLSTLLVCCAKNSDNSAEVSKEKLNIVTTIFPEYDWVKELTKGNDNVEITMLLDNGVDLHSFQPTADDIVKVASCDMFIYVGGESDEWVEDALSEATNKDMVVINLLDVLKDTIKEEELVEGMEAEEEEESEAEEEEEVEYDEHVWLSIKCAKTICKEIAAKLETVDSSNKALYEENLASYLGQLDALDTQYEEVVASAAQKTVLFGDRFPFRYMTDDYGLNYYAAFVGCSAESEASFETITFLANKVDELGLNSVLQIESADGKIATTIIENTSEKNQEILTLDSMQSTSSKDVENNASYLSIMESNLEVLKKAIY